MRFRLLLTLLTCLCIYAGNAQTAIFKGNISDTTLDNPKLKNASITLSNARDSILYKFTRSKNDGSFSINGIVPGKYVLIISHPDYADYSDIIELKEEENSLDFVLLSKAHLLETVIIRGSPIRMKGDTLMFMADSFKVHEGANVEDLLKQLPGFQVNAKGEIKANGQSITKVLVDGDEFFGDDPTLATRNLLAKSVKEVQVFDKTSDQAAFTGVNDGNTQKTVNLKLKDEYKNGYFGKINLAGGNDEKWENSAMINAFTSKRKLSGYGKMSSTENIGLGWGEDNQYGGNINSNVVMDGGSVSISNDGNPLNGVGSYWGEGLPKFWMGGFSYTDKWNQEKNKIVANYRYSKLNNETEKSTISQFILADSSYYTNQKQSSYSSQYQNVFNTRNDIVLDSLNSVLININGSKRSSENFSDSRSQSLNSDKEMVNENSNKLSNLNNTENLTASVLWRKKFAKPKRTLSVNAGLTYNKSDGTSYLFNELFYTSKLEKDTTDQLKESTGKSSTINTKAIYTEPVSKNALVEFNYNIIINNRDQQLLSYDKVAGKYDDLNEEFSNQFEFQSIINKAGVAYRYSTSKMNFGFGGDIGRSNWKQNDLFQDIERKYNFTNYFPMANFRYNISQYSRISFNYNGSTREPNINQMQPVANNNDPLNIAIGNPNLKQAFDQRFNLSYNKYDVLTEKSIWSYLSFSTANNDFSSFSTIDTNGVRRYQTVNVNGNIRMNGYFDVGFPVFKKFLNMGFSFNPAISKLNNYVNDVFNTTWSRSLEIGTSVRKNVPNKYELSISNNVRHNYSKSEVNKNLKTDYFTNELSFDARLLAIKTFEFKTTVGYNWRQKTDIFTSNNNVLIWHAEVNKRVSKKQDIRVGIIARDILNQNIGFQRNINSNLITETNYNTIRQYFMLNVKWSFNKGAQKEQEW